MRNECEANGCNSSGSAANSYTIQMMRLGELTKQYLLNVKKISDIHTYKLNSSLEGPEVRCVSSSVHKGKSCGKPTEELEELAHPPHMITRRPILPTWSKSYFSPRWKVADRDQTAVTYRVFAYRVFRAGGGPTNGRGILWRKTNTSQKRSMGV